MLYFLKLFILPHSRDVDPVVLAIRGGDVEVVQKVAESSPHSLLRENKDGWIPLHHAAFNGQHDCLRTLLKGIGVYKYIQMSTFGSQMSPSSALRVVSCSSTSRFCRQTHLAGTDWLAACCVFWTFVVCEVSSGVRSWSWHQQQEQSNPFVLRSSGSIICQAKQLWTHRSQH